jgi:hypothetical protein
MAVMVQKKSYVVMLLSHLRDPYMLMLPQNTDSLVLSEDDAPCMNAYNMFCYGGRWWGSTITHFYPTVRDDPLERKNESCIEGFQFLVCEESRRSCRTTTALTCKATSGS